MFKSWKILGFSAAVLLTAACSHQSPSTSSSVDAPVATEAAATRSTAMGMVPRGIDFSKAPQVVAFSSCANQDQPQPLWKTIEKHEPDLFLFTGDVIYSVSPEQKPVAEQYRKLSQIPEYRSFREKVPIMAMWDDNDYGQKDGGVDNPDKEAYKREFLRHFPYIKDSISWNQGGLYHVKYIGGSSTTTGRRRKRITKKEPTLQVIMLDTRYYRDALKKSEAGDGGYVPEEDKTKTMLGEEQWAWLEDQLSQPAELRFIVSSIQVVAGQHRFEKWANLPAEQSRLYELLKKKNIRNAVVISGDRHRGSIAKYDIKGLGPLFDITASSINRPLKETEEDPTYIGPTIPAENFGLARIDWQKRRVKFELRGMEDQVANSVEFKF